MTLGAGRFNRRVEWHEPIRDDAGEITGYVHTFTSHASIEPIRGREQLIANQILADMDTRIVVRRNRNTVRIGASWRGQYKDTRYDIKAPPVDIRMEHRELEILCKSGLSQG